jgi:hypothetical protein
MSTEQKQPPKTKSVDTTTIDNWNLQFFKLNRRMARKIDFEEDKFAQKQPPQRPEGPMPDMPAPYPGKKEIDSNISKVKALPVEERKAKWEFELKSLDELGKKLLTDKAYNNDTKKPIALEFKNGRERIQAEIANDVNEIKNFKIQRKKTVTDQLDSIKQSMSQVEKLGSDKGEVSQAVMAYNSAKAQLLKALTQDMTDDNLKTADAAVKQLKAATEKALAVDQAKRDRIGKSQQTVNSLAPNLKPDDNSFPKGVAKTIGKDTSRPVLGSGPLFKQVIKGLEAVEESSDEKNLTLLENAAKAYLADYDKRVADGQKSGKPFRPDKITTTKADTCRDALEKVRKLRVTRDIQDGLQKLPKNPRSPDEEAGLNRLKAKMIVESGGGKQLDSSESGASESFFLTDPTTKEKNFIFKPSDGEFDAGYGWKKGGGAPREVALSAVSESLKNSLGLDCGVSQTTLVKVNSPSVATERNGKNPERVGAIQNFVPSNKALTEKLDINKPGYDKSFINQIPPEEIEKVALLDFVTLQMDRQASNLLVQPDSTGAPRLTPIDAGNAMPSRKAFEASRRMFTNNAVLGGDEAKKPFSPEALKKIDDMDENAIVAAMKKANTEMAKVDPQSGTAVEDETIEMTRRSVLFLKQAAKVLTKAEIADAYAYQFQNVLDADAKNVDKAIKDAIKAQQAKGGLLDAIDKFPNGKTVFADLGWPADELYSMRSEDPARLLDILTNGKQCPATVKEINEIIAKVGLKNFDTDPNTIPSLAKRLIEVRSKKVNLEYDEILADPELDKKAKKVGAEFVTVSPKGEKKPMTSAKAKADRGKEVNDYLAAGGDDALKKRGKSPSKMTFQEKYFESLGGDELLAELAKKGLNPYDGTKLEYKISDLQDYQEYLKLGGDDVYYTLGCPQNKEVTINNRNNFMKQKLAMKK